MTYIRVTAAGIRCNAPLLCSRGRPELVKCHVPVNVEDDEVAATCIVSEPVTLSEMGGAPAVASTHPTLQPLK